jgi:peptide/nickel transport system substrate-binding protein
MKKLSRRDFLKASASGIAAAALAGCAAPTAAPAPTSAPAKAAATAVPAQPKVKDTIIFATATDQNFMDGHMNNTNDKVLRTVYSSLIKRTAKNELVGDLASKWEVGADGVTWTFTLKKGVKFHSGKELTSKDVKASYDRLMNTKTPVRYTSVVSYLKEVKMVDDYTVQLITVSKMPNFATNMTHRAHLILDADYITKYAEKLGQSVETVNGTGPYKLVKWDKNEQQVFESFKDYFGGQAPTKNLIIKIIPEASSRSVAMETGEIDIADGLAVEDLNRLEKVRGIAVKYYPGIGMHGFQFNCAHKFLSDVRLRKAVSYAIDRELIVKTLYNTAAGEVPATGPVNPNVWGYNNFGVIKQDKAKAKALLAEAGVPNGFEFSMAVYEGYVKAKASAEMIVSQLAEVGIKATIQIVDNAGFNALMGNRKAPGDNMPYGMFIMGYGPSSVDADDLRRTWITSPDGNNNNNYGWYSNKDFDRIMTEEAGTMDDAKRKELLKQAMQIIYIDDPSAVYTNDRVLSYAMKDKVVGFEINVVQAIAWDKLAINE